MRDDKWVPSPEWIANDFDDSTWNPPTEAVSYSWMLHDILEDLHMEPGTWVKEHKFIFTHILYGVLVRIKEPVNNSYHVDAIFVTERFPACCTHSFYTQRYVQPYLSTTDHLFKLY